MSQINEIEIGGVVYDLAGSGSGGGTGYSKTVLWTGNSAPSEITFESSLKDYDLILFEGMLSNGVGNYTLSNIYSKEDIVDNRELGVYSNESYLWYHYAADSDTITLSAGSANNVLTNIIGIKFSGGSGEGGSSTLSDLTDVELDESPSAGQVLTYDADSSKWINANVTGGTEVTANPEAEATEELEKIKIGDTVYSIPEGGGSGGASSAEEISFNPSLTRLEVTNVQDAIDKTYAAIPTEVGTVVVGNPPSQAEGGELTKIKINGITYSVPTNVKEVIELTESEYSALENPSADVLYCIKDGVMSTAETVEYDNSKSKLTSTTMQGAMDEMAAILNNLVQVEKSGETF